jgi:hypothetical protein
VPDAQQIRKGIVEIGKLKLESFVREPLRDNVASVKR